MVRKATERKESNEGSENKPNPTSDEVNLRTKNAVSKSHELKAKRTKKAPGAPLRPRSPYLFFCAEKREEVRANLEEKKETEVLRRLGLLWRSLALHEREKYLRLGEGDRTRYLAEIKKYTGPLKVQIGKAKRESSMVICPRTPFNFFQKKSYAEFKANFPEMPASDIGKMIGAAWGGMQENDKEPYRILSKEDKARYDKEFACRAKESKGESRRKDESKDESMKIEPASVKSPNKRKREEKAQKISKLAREEGKCVSDAASKSLPVENCAEGSASLHERSNENNNVPEEENGSKKGGGMEEFSQERVAEV